MRRNLTTGIMNNFGNRAFMGPDRYVGQSERRATPDKVKILIVEDEMPLAMAMISVLTMMGCDVEAAHTGKKAIEKAAETKFDLIHRVGLARRKPHGRPAQFLNAGGLLVNDCSFR